jgi:hypothetical protein
MGLLATKLYIELYGKPPKKVRSSTKPAWRNTVSRYPCGILEQAYRELKADPVVATHAVRTDTTREDQTTTGRLSG